MPVGSLVVPDGCRAIGVGAGASLGLGLGLGGGRLAQSQVEEEQCLVGDDHPAGPEQFPSWPAGLRRACGASGASGASGWGPNDANCPVCSCGRKDVGTSPENHPIGQAKARMIAAVPSRPVIEAPYMATVQRARRTYPSPTEVILAAVIRSSSRRATRAA
jgi:hypothetical protein